jgi:flagellar biosynthesis protein FlhA
LVGEIVGTEGEISIGLFHRVLRNLLKEGVPIKELTTILESLAEHAAKTKNATTLTELVRKSLSRTITEQYKDENGKISAIILDPVFEHQIISSLKQESGQSEGLDMSGRRPVGSTADFVGPTKAAGVMPEFGGIILAIPAEIAMQLSRKIALAWKSVMEKGKEKVVLLCDSRLRCQLATILSRIVPLLPVIAYDEIILGTDVEPIETITIQQTEQAAEQPARPERSPGPDQTGLQQAGQEQRGLRGEPVIAGTVTD